MIYATTDMDDDTCSAYVSCFSHSTSFASAFPRCEITFFLSLGISAYVWPSYSKQASQPAWSVSTRTEAHTFDLGWRLTKVGWSSSWNDHTLHVYAVSLVSGGKSTLVHLRSCVPGI